MRFLRFPLLRQLAAPALLLLGSLLPVSAGDFYLKDGDSVVFYGDSITGQRMYTSFVETFVLTRFPEKHITFTHSGVGGDRVDGGGAGNIRTRLQRDVYPYQPTVVTVMLGMNDGAVQPFDQGRFDRYKRGMEFIVSQLEKNLPDARVTLIQPSPYDDVTFPPKFEGGYNAVLRRFAEVVGEIGRAHHKDLADLNTPVVAMLEKAKAIDPELAKRIFRDRVHPRESGHLILAAALLEAWHAPATVSSVTIDAAGKKVAAEENTAVSNLQVSAKEISWSQLDQALPMPVDLRDAATALAVRAADFFAKLNQQTLRLTGLPNQEYAVQIDGEPLGVFSAQELAAGINLAEYNTPMQRQAAAVHQLTLKRTGIHHTLWLDTRVPLARQFPDQTPQLEKFAAASAQAVQALAAIQREAARPRPHTFSVRPLDPARQGSAIDTPPADLGPNLALEKKWRSSDANPHGWSAGLTDGIWEGKMPHVYSTHDSPLFPKQVTIDLEKDQTLAHILLGVPAYGSTRTVQVAVSADNQNFQTVGHYTFSLRQAEKRLFSFPAVNARYLRVTFANHYEDSVDGFSPYRGFLADVQAFAPRK